MPKIEDRCMALYNIKIHQAFILFYCVTVVELYYDIIQIKIVPSKIYSYYYYYDNSLIQLKINFVKATKYLRETSVMTTLKKFSQQLPLSLLGLE